MRRFGEPQQEGQAYRQRPGAYGVIIGADGVLLTLEDTRPPEVQLPGGGIDPDETPVRALHREVYEETGWRIRVIRRLGAYQRYGYMPEYDLWARKICHIYLCVPVRRLGPVPEPHHTVIWATIDAASSTLSNSGDRHFFERAVAGLR